MTSVLDIKDEACRILQFYHTMGRLGTKTYNKANLCFKIAGQHDRISH